MKLQLSRKVTMESKDFYYDGTCMIKNRNNKPCASMTDKQGYCQKCVDFY